MTPIEEITISFGTLFVIFGIIGILIYCDEKKNADTLR
jgi:hypothetical protein